jgi:predicted RNase H-like nuclease
MFFVGVDLAWRDNTSGAVLLEWRGDGVVLRCARVLGDNSEILRFIENVGGGVVVAVDAPLVISNPPGTARPVDLMLSRVFRRFHAATLPSDVTSAPRAGELLKALYGLGFSYTVLGERTVIEVYPHASQVALFGLEKTLKYKRGRVFERKRELARLQELIRICLPVLVPPLRRNSLFDEITAVDVGGLRGRGLKEFEDILDALICAYTACYYWYWREERCFVFRDAAGGCIVTPRVV